MVDDIRYAELLFLQGLPRGYSEVFNHHDARKAEASGLNPTMYLEMVLTMIEEMYVRIEDQKAQLLVGKLRGEISTRQPSNMIAYQWENPRETLEQMFLGNNLQSLRLTYRGLRRIDELREVLARDRILEPFGVLQSMQYFRKDLQDALRLNSDTAVSVLYADLDHFKQVNTKFGQSAGDVVMEAYLKIARDQIGLFGEAYRGLGDEVAVLIKGQGHDRAVKFAEKIRQAVKALACTYEGHTLPKVTASIGVASAPPEDRKMELETLAEDRKRKAKEDGRDRVIAS
jgi:diguanylate cyclase (GGDEF)-like protein